MRMPARRLCAHCRRFGSAPNGRASTVGIQVPPNIGNDTLLPRAWGLRTPNWNLLVQVQGRRR